MVDLQDLRNEIDSIDRQMTELLRSVWRSAEKWQSTRSAPAKGV